MPRHFHDDDDDAPDVRPADDARSAAGLLLTLLLVGAVAIGLGGTAVVGLLLMRADRVQQEMRMAETQAQFAAAQAAIAAAQMEVPEAVVPDPLPDPNPPAREGP